MRVHFLVQFIAVAFVSISGLHASGPELNRAMPNPPLNNLSSWNTHGNHTVKNFKHSHGPDGLHIDVWTPVEAGRYPTVAFASAFGLNAPVSGYSDLFSRLASHGIIIAGVSKLNDPDYPKLASEVATAVRWMQQNLTAAIVASGCPAVADMGQLVLWIGSALWRALLFCGTGSWW